MTLFNDLAKPQVQQTQQTQQTQQAQQGVASSGMLARTWRPLTMIAFVALIVARWLGFVRPDISEAEVLAMWSVVQYSMGGYVVGRSLEKIAPVVASAIGGVRQ
jgi:hypothetical protein